MSQARSRMHARSASKRWGHKEGLVARKRTPRLARAMDSALAWSGDVIHVKDFLTPNRVKPTNLSRIFDLAAEAAHGGRATSLEDHR